MEETVEQQYQRIASNLEKKPTMRYKTLVAEEDIIYMKFCFKDRTAAWSVMIPVPESLREDVKDELLGKGDI